MTDEERLILERVQDMFIAQQGLDHGLPFHERKSIAYDKLMDACHGLCAEHDGAFVISESA